MIQTTLLLDSSAAMGVACPELPPTKAIGLRPYLAHFATSYLATSPLALLSVVAMRDGTAATLCPFTSSEAAALEALETRFFMMPPSGMMSLENGLRLCGMNMRLTSSFSSSLPTPRGAASSSIAPAGGGSTIVKREGGNASGSSGRVLTAEEELRMDKGDIAFALQSAVAASVSVADTNGTGNEARGGAAGPSAAPTGASGGGGESVRSCTVAQRRIVVVTGAVSVLDPTNVYEAIKALASNGVSVDVISLMGAPFVLAELARRTGGAFYCPLSGGGEQLRQQLTLCARLARRRRGKKAHAVITNNGVGGSADLTSLSGVKREREGEEEVGVVSANAPTPLYPRFGGVRRVLSQDDEEEGGGFNNNGAAVTSVAIGFPVTALEVAAAAATTAPSSSAASSTSSLPNSQQVLLARLATGAPSQPLCSRCHNPVAVPSVCSVCGLLACALPQIHRAFAALDAQQGEEEEEDTAKKGDSEAAAGSGGQTSTDRDGDALAPAWVLGAANGLTGGGGVEGVVPNILPPSFLAVLLPRPADAPRVRCACCGFVLPTTVVGAKEDEREDVEFSACRCGGCGGVRCLSCDAFIRESLLVCPTCVGS